jgi:hypothetical protein
MSSNKIDNSSPTKGGLINKLVELDKYYSGKIHNMEMPAIF